MKWTAAPPVVVRGFARPIEGQGMGRSVRLRRRCDGRSHGFQQLLEFNFRLHALKFGGRWDLDLGHRNLRHNYRRAIASYDCVFLIAADGREKGPFVSRLFEQASARHSAIVRHRIPSRTAHRCVLCAQFERAEVRQSIGNFEFSF
jgi:hypothetical protein